MCGIIGYLGNRSAVPIVVGGLKELEYRGYDSSGIAAITDDDQVLFEKQVGRIEDLERKLDGSKLNPHLGIGHTRWATHGVPSSANSHPHSNTDKTIFVVHNGIIENYKDIRSRLEENGYTFTSETDSEVIPQLIDYYYKNLGTFKAALIATINDLKGAYAIAVISTLDPGKMYLSRLGSPLVIGVADDEFVIASDANALLKHTKKVTYLDDYDVATLSKGKLDIVNIKDKNKSAPKVELIEYKSEASELGDFPNFMLKEIYEIPETMQTAIRGRALVSKNMVKLGGLDNVLSQLSHIDRIIIVGCGTSYYAGLVGEYLIEELAGIPVEVQLASEFKYRNEPISRSTCVIAVSQSGETADTIAALKKIEDFGVLKLGIVNSVGSTISRITDAGVYCHAGPEKAVASTKSFIAQVTILTLIALRLNDGSSKLYKPVLSELEKLPKMIQAVLDQSDNIKEIAMKYKNYKDFLYIGRGYNYPSALEGAIKLKEISYIHAEGYAAGEMKHGPIAMIDASFPTVAIATNGELIDKIYSSMEEIKARSGPLIAVATVGNKEISKLADDVIYIPDSLEQTQPILVCVALQLFSYHMATELGRDVDKPRNLAKSVTVE
ncbi:MAG TPA: glutamine--fructose-6-phosphate transaminase (isomerizing) [Candidatus Saccharimonadales bacterium]